MAENKDGQEKTEDATAKRLKEAKGKGQVAKSMDVTTAALLLIGGMALFVAGPHIFGNLRKFFDYTFRHSAEIELTYDSVTMYYPELLGFLAWLILPVIVFFTFVILVAEYSQVGFNVATKRWTDPETYKKIFKIGSGLKRIFFSSKSLFELLKSIAKIVVLGALVAWIVYLDMDEIVSIADKPYYTIAEMMIKMSFKILLSVGLLYIMVAAADFIFQKWKHKEDMKMTKQEVKDENKQMEGDPQIKAKLKSIMRSKFRKMMIKNVADADVVITNPTHFAVALKYDRMSMNAPKVVAKGADFLAAKIREVARENSIEIYEDPPLARTLFYNVEIDSEIPENLFKVVAKVLAYVFKLRKGKAVA